MPGVKCGSCRKYMSPIDAAKCSKCSVSYHRLCMSLPRSGTIGLSWRCSACAVSTVEPHGGLIPGTPMNTASTAAQETFSEVELELRRIREELRAVRGEFQAFREEIADLRKLSLRVNGIEKRVEDLEQSCKLEATACSPSRVDEIVTQLKLDLNDRDQELLSTDVEIANIPESHGENLCHTVRLIAKKLDVSLEERDIISADRVGGRHLIAIDSSGPSEARPRLIVVRLSRRDLRDAVLRAARVRRGADTSDLDLPGQPRRFFINERLTKLNRALFRQAREAGTQSGWRFVWTNRGRIYARQRPGEAACRIRIEDDISRIFRTGDGSQENTVLNSVRD